MDDYIEEILEQTYQSEDRYEFEPASDELVEL